MAGSSIASSVHTQLVLERRQRPTNAARAGQLEEGRALVILGRRIEASMLSTAALIATSVLLAGSSAMRASASSASRRFGFRRGPCLRLLHPQQAVTRASTSRTADATRSDSAFAEPMMSLCGAAAPASDPVVFHPTPWGRRLQILAKSAA